MKRRNFIKAISVIVGAIPFFGQAAKEKLNPQQINRNITFAEHMAKQPKYIQDEILGTARGRLFRSGKLNIAARNGPIDLKTLRERIPE